MNLVDASWVLAPEPGTAAPVCVVAHAHPDLSKGGGETAAYRQVQTLRGAGQRAILVAAAEPGLGPEPILPHGPDEYLFSTEGMEEDRLFWADIGARRELVRFLARQPVRVFHFHHLWRVGIDLAAELMEARPDARFAVTLHEMLAICANHGQMIRPQGREPCRAASPTRCAACFPDRAPRHFALRRATFLDVLRRFDAVIYPSAFLRGRFRDWGLAAAEEVVLENYLGDALAGSPRRVGAEPGMAGHFAFFGQPTPFKGLDVLLRGFALALRAAPQLALSIFGCERDDVLRMFPALAPTLDQAGPAVSFLGRYDQEDVLHLMQGVGWVVVPSIWWENSPVVIQEAMRAGTPLVVSDIGGMAEKVRPGLDGLHFRRGSAPDLARVLHEAADPARHAAISATLADSIRREDFLAGLERAFGMVSAEAG
ncbi:glycosyltransferase [Neoroseomonas soli]|uniref:Glycosyltransferase family 4 protein n=1 Tax=Neoroseomonas soli TaxID=1081025 RepID=A0A9X9X2J1_9PROT|nr:glycosyltransferase [Neoroseomonas soli]MBR0673620.1 glycosyltransferase family 4 protein [Neoroseomonas soli]